MPPKLSTDFSRAAVGAFGMVASVLPTTFATILPQIELWLRIISLCVGIAVGTATFISIVLSIRRNKKRPDSPGGLPPSRGGSPLGPQT